MAEHTMTLLLPKAVYEHLKERTRHSQRPIEDEAARVLAVTLGNGSNTVSDI